MPQYVAPDATTRKSQNGQSGTYPGSRSRSPRAKRGTLMKGNFTPGALFSLLRRVECFGGFGRGLFCRRGGCGSGGSITQPPVQSLHPELESPGFVRDRSEGTRSSASHPDSRSLNKTRACRSVRDLPIVGLPIVTCSQRIACRDSATDAERTASGRSALCPECESEPHAAWCVLRPVVQFQDHLAECYSRGDASVFRVAGIYIRYQDPLDDYQ